MSTTLLIADDQKLFAESLKTVLEARAADFAVVEVVYEGEKAVQKTLELKPDIVLMDVRMPYMDGIEAVRRIKEQRPDQKIAMLTTYDDDHYVRAATSYGALGYIMKDIEPEDLVNSIRAIKSGAFLTTGSVAKKAQKQQLNPYVGDSAHEDMPYWYYELSRNDRQLLRMLIEGYNNNEIADAVSLAPQTVRNYLSRIYTKLEVDGRAHAIKVARRYQYYL